jgi:hypothetical protein
MQWKTYTWDSIEDYTWDSIEDTYKIQGNATMSLQETTNKKHCQSIVSAKAKKHIKPLLLYTSNLLSIPLNSTSKYSSTPLTF